MAYRLHLPCKVKSRCYLLLVWPVLGYTSPVWVNCGQRDPRTLEKLQLQAARAARHGFAPLAYSDPLQRLNWPMLAWRRRLFCLLLFWMLMHHHGPPELVDMLPLAAGARADYDFRKRQNMEVPCTSTQPHSKSFLPSTVVLWNDLPSS